MNTRRRLTQNHREPGKKINGGIFGSLHTSIQQPNALKAELLIGMRIEYLSSIDMEKEGSETNVLWMGGTVERVSYGTCLMPGPRIKCYK